MCVCDFSPENSVIFKGSIPKGENSGARWSLRIYVFCQHTNAIPISETQSTIPSTNPSPEIVDN